MTASSIIARMSSVRRRRDELVADLHAHLPREREPPLRVAAPT